MPSGVPEAQCHLDKNEIKNSVCKNMYQMYGCSDYLHFHIVRAVLVIKKVCLHIFY